MSNCNHGPASAHQCIDCLQDQLSAAIIARDEYKAEWEAACDRLKSSDHVIKEMQARERDMVADLNEAREALQMFVELAASNEEWMRADGPTPEMMRAARAALAASAGDK